MENFDLINGVIVLSNFSINSFEYCGLERDFDSKTFDFCSAEYASYILFCF